MEDVANMYMSIQDAKHRNAEPEQPNKVHILAVGTCIQSFHIKYKLPKE
jgi:hypothetical protein